MYNRNRKLKTRNANPAMSKTSVRAKKTVLVVCTAAVCAMLGCICASAAVDTSEFIATAQTALTAVIALVGAGLAAWGIVNLIEGYGNDNPGAKSQGMKQLMAGIALVAVGVLLVPVLGNMMTGAITA